MYIYILEYMYISVFLAIGGHKLSNKKANLLSTNFDVGGIIGTL